MKHEGSLYFRRFMEHANANANAMSRWWRTGRMRIKTENEDDIGKDEERKSRMT